MTKFTRAFLFVLFALFCSGECLAQEFGEKSELFQSLLRQGRISFIEQNPQVAADDFRQASALIQSEIPVSPALTECVEKLTNLSQHIQSRSIYTVHQIDPILSEVSQLLSEHYLQNALKHPSQTATLIYAIDSANSHGKESYIWAQKEVSGKAALAFKAASEFVWRWQNNPEQVPQTLEINKLIQDLRKAVKAAND